MGPGLVVGPGSTPAPVTMGHGSTVQAGMTCNFGTWSSHGICNGGNSNTRTWINGMFGHMPLLSCASEGRLGRFERRVNGVFHGIHLDRVGCYCCGWNTSNLTTGRLDGGSPT
jgi:hypothetical protein